MKSFHCPFCNVDMALNSSTHSIQYPSFERSHGLTYNNSYFEPDESCVEVEFFKCPTCEKYSIFVNSCGTYSKDLNVCLIPNSLAKQFPEYVPSPIRKDYEEAYSIVDLSPKASATLSRRCLQGMIRDFYGISKSRLIDEINELQDIIPSTQWKAIDSLRKIGNIGAHMEKDVNSIVDVDSDEAHKLLKLIELLIDKWYISRHDEEQLLMDITSIASNKTIKKKSNPFQ